MYSWWPRTGCCYRMKSCACRDAAASTSTLRSCRAGRGAAPIQRALPPVIPRAEFRSCTWSEPWIQVRSTRAARFRSSRRKRPWSLQEGLARLGAAAILDVLDAVAAGTAVAQPQTGPATYAARIEKSEARIDWSQAAAQIERQVRAFNPWPVAETSWARPEASHLVGAGSAATSRCPSWNRADIRCTGHCRGVRRRSAGARCRSIAGSQAFAGE